MSEFLGLLTSLKEGSKEFVVAVDGHKVRVKADDILGDLVTLREQGGGNRYDLHYTQVIICSRV